MRSHKKLEVQTVQRQYRSKIRPGERENWSGVRIRVPPLPDSCLAYCSCIDVVHFLEVGCQAEKKFYIYSSAFLLVWKKCTASLPGSKAVNTFLEYMYIFYIYTVIC